MTSLRERRSNLALNDCFPSNMADRNGSQADHHLPQATPPRTAGCPEVCHLCHPAPTTWLPPSPAPSRGTSGHYACLWRTPLLPRRSHRRRHRPAAPSYVAEPRHCRHLVGARWRIALKHMGFQHQRTKSSPFVFGIGSVTGIAPQKTVKILPLPEAPCWTVNP